MFILIILLTLKHSNFFYKDFIDKNFKESPYEVNNILKKLGQDVITSLAIDYHGKIGNSIITNPEDKNNVMINNLGDRIKYNPRNKSDDHLNRYTMILTLIYILNFFDTL